MQTTTQEKFKQTLIHKNSTPEAKLLKIDRKFNVAVDKLFQAFTTSDSIKAWWWPNDFYSDRVDLDFREGGKYFINMKGFDKAIEVGGGGMTGQFEEIVKNRRIVMTDSFADEKGNAISAAEAKMPGSSWPKIAYITFEFEPVSENRSQISLSQEGIPNETQKECIQGWNEMFDKLEKYLSGSKI